jgi:hypothetical protein
LTVHKLDAPFKGFPGYQPVEKTVAAHPILADLALATKRVPNPFRKAIPQARGVEIRADKSLTFEQRSFAVRPGEVIRLTFQDPLRRCDLPPRA